MDDKELPILNNYKFERIRKKFKPKKIKILLIGESPPEGRDFFYELKSSLYEYTKKAYLNTYKKDISNKGEFLKLFIKSGIYLDDLCHHPINNFDDPLKEIKRKRSKPFLTKRLKSYNPDVIVILMIGIEKHVKEAIKLSGIKCKKIYTTHFPSMSWHNLYFEEITTIFDELQ